MRVVCSENEGGIDPDNIDNEKCVQNCMRRTIQGPIEGL